MRDHSESPAWATDGGCKVAAWTMTRGVVAAMVSAMVSGVSHFIGAMEKVAGRPKMAARALAAVRSQSMRSGLRPPMATLRGFSAPAARSKTTRAAKAPVPATKTSHFSTML